MHALLHPSKRSTLSAGLMAVAVLALGLLLWDGYVFYLSISRAAIPRPEQIQQGEITASDIDTAVGFIRGEREKIRVLTSAFLPSPTPEAIVSPGG